MNRYYAEFLRAMDVPAWMLDCVEGRYHPIPDPSASVPPRNYGFPPVLIPLWSEDRGPWYVGLWRHWFVPRASSYVRYCTETSRVTEIAHTPKQIFAGMAVYLVSILINFDPDAVDALGEYCGMSIDDLIRHARRHGDDPTALDRLPIFAVDPPLICKPGYESGLVLDDSDATLVRSSCVFEVSDRSIADWSTRHALPEWLIGSPQLAFESALARRDFGGAWLSINSRGWTIPAARSALTELDRAAGDADFSLLVRAWIEASDAQRPYG